VDLASNSRLILFFMYWICILLILLCNYFP
jgi:hypothetical protein